jgi:eukaryotic-like serine/threonine-protein kinase
MGAQRAKEVFFELLGAPEEEHAELIATLCGDDVELRDRVERLLRAHSGAGDFLGASAELATLTSTPDGEGSHEAGWYSEDPERIGMYTVVRVLGRGGFGTVYLCEQHEPIERRVAVKVVQSGMDTQAVLRRFEDERVLLSKMDHPGIARVLDAGRTEGGQPFIAMEYVEGETITDYSNARRLGVRERLGLFVQACQAVGHAHQKMVIHRDVKPSNVLVTEVDGRAVVKVIDFGISKALDAELGDDTVTRTMQLVGTPQYMSPEQASTSGGDLDTRTDVYSLGVMLYELVTGVLPFDSRKLRSARVGQLERMIREIEPQRPSTRVSRLEGDVARSVSSGRDVSSGQLARELRGEVDWIVSKAMAKERDRRYASVSELGEDVGRYLDGRVVQARAPSGAYVLRKLIARNKAWSMVAALVVLGLIGVTTMSLVHAKRIKDANTRIQATLDNQESVLRFTEEMLQGIDPAVARGQDTTLFRELLDTASDRVNIEVGGSAEVETRLRVLIGELYRSIGMFDEAMAQFRAASAIGIEGLGNGHFQTIAARSALGAAHVELTEYQEGVEILEEVYEDARESLGVDHVDTLSVLGNLSAAYGYIGNLEMAVRSGESLLRSRIRVLGDYAEDTMATRNNLALSLKAMGESERARGMFERVLAYQVEHMGEDHPNTLKTRTNLALVYQELEEYQRAVEMNEAVLEQKISVLGETHPSVLVSMVNLSAVLEKTGEQERAGGLLDRALATSIETLGDEHQYTLIIQNNLANFHARNGSHELAIGYARRSLAGLERSMGVRHPMVVQSRLNLGELLNLVGSHEEALEAGMTAAPIAAEVFEAGDHRHGKVYEVLGEAYRGLGRDGEAREYLDVAAGVYLGALGEDSDSYTRVLESLEALE